MHFSARKLYRLGQWRGYICSLQTVKGFCCCTQTAGVGLAELVCWSVLQQQQRSCRACLLVGLAATAVLQNLSAGRSCRYSGLAELVCWSVLQLRRSCRACLLVGSAAATAVSQNLSAGRSCSSYSGVAEPACCVPGTATPFSGSGRKLGERDRRQQ